MYLLILIHSCLCNTLPSIVSNDITTNTGPNHDSLVPDVPRYIRIFHNEQLGGYVHITCAESSTAYSDGVKVFGNNGFLMGSTSNPIRCHEVLLGTNMKLYAARKNNIKEKLLANVQVNAQFLVAFSGTLTITTGIFGQSAIYLNNTDFILIASVQLGPDSFITRLDPYTGVEEPPVTLQYSTSGSIKQMFELEHIGVVLVGGYEGISLVNKPDLSPISTWFHYYSAYFYCVDSLRDDIVYVTDYGLYTMNYTSQSFLSSLYLARHINALNLDPYQYVIGISLFDLPIRYTLVSKLDYQDQTFFFSNTQYIRFSDHLILLNTHDYYFSLISYSEVSSVDYFNLNTFFFKVDNCTSRHANGTCSQCIDFTYLSNSSTDNQCLSPPNFPPSYGIDSQSMFIRPCTDPLCSDCTGDHTICVECPQMSLLQSNGSCRVFPGFSYNPNISKIVACDISGCVDCSDDYSKCNVCKKESGYFLRSGSCVKRDVLKVNRSVYLEVSRAALVEFDAEIDHIDLKDLSFFLYDDDPTNPTDLTRLESIKITLIPRGVSIKFGPASHFASAWIIISNRSNNSYIASKDERTFTNFPINITNIAMISLDSPTSKSNKLILTIASIVSTIGLIFLSSFSKRIAMTLLKIFSSLLFLYLITPPFIRYPFNLLYQAQQFTIFTFDLNQIIRKWIGTPDYSSGCEPNPELSIKQISCSILINYGDDIILQVFIFAVSIAISLSTRIIILIIKPRERDNKEKPSIQAEDGATADNKSEKGSRMYRLMRFMNTHYGIHYICTVLEGSQLEVMVFSIIHISYYSHDVYMLIGALVSLLFIVYYSVIEYIRCSVYYSVWYDVSNVISKLPILHKTPHASANPDRGEMMEADPLTPNKQASAKHKAKNPAESLAEIGQRGIGETVDVLSYKHIRYAQHIEEYKTPTRLLQLVYMSVFTVKNAALLTIGIHIFTSKHMQYSLYMLVEGVWVLYSARHDIRQDRWIRYIDMSTCVVSMVYVACMMWICSVRDVHLQDRIGFAAMVLLIVMLVVHTVYVAVHIIYSVYDAVRSFIKSNRKKSIVANESKIIGNKREIEEKEEREEEVLGELDEDGLRKKRVLQRIESSSVDNRKQILSGERVSSRKWKNEWRSNRDIELESKEKKDFTKTIMKQTIDNNHRPSNISTRWYDLLTQGMYWNS